MKWPSFATCLLCCLAMLNFSGGTHAQPQLLAPLEAISNGSDFFPGERSVDLRSIVTKQQRGFQCNPSPIFCGQTVFGSLSSLDCDLGGGKYAEVYDFFGSAGDLVRIEVDSFFDAELYLYFQSTGNLVAYDDDGGVGNDPVLEGALPATGFYDVLVANESFGTGSFDLTLTCQSAPPALPPAAPSNARLENVQQDSLRLRWNDNSNNESGFEIQYRVGTGAFQYAAVAGANATSIQFTGLQPATDYDFRVRAFNGGGFSGFSNTASGTTSGVGGPPPSPPIAPSNVRVQNVQQTSLQLLWNDNSNNETGFEVQMRRGTGVFQPLNTYGANTSTATVTGLDPGTNYAFRVRSFNSAGYSAFSNLAAASTKSPDGPQTGCVENDTTLCLQAGRFEVKTDWRTAQGSSGQGMAVPITSDTGYFWFFSETNVELVVKVLNGCSVNNHFWVFAGGLTNVEVTLTVRDVLSGLSETYRNPLQTAFRPVVDTAALMACP